MKRSLFPRGLLSVAVMSAMGLAPMAFAQETSTAIRGVVTGADGQPVNNAKIIAIHTPSNSRREILSSESGRFNLNGLRVGGPYTIRVESEEGEEVLNDIYLSLGSPLTLPINLGLSDAEVRSIEEVVVFADTQVYTNRGSSGVFGEDQISNAATFSRDIKDVVRANPLATVSPDGVELSIAGSNPRYNSITIDSVGINDTFGLNYSGYPTTRPPIALDSVEQLSVEYAPFNARKGKFSGGNINAVTKSGSNEFHGSVFFESVPWTGTAKDYKLVEKDAVDEEGNPIKYNPFDIENEEETVGLTFSGPILEDKLFFFTSYEKWEEDLVFNYDLESLSGHKVTTAERDRVLQIMQDVYGVTDGVGAAPSADSDEKLLVKLDWNISDDHRADFTYNKQEGKAGRNYTDDDGTLRLSSNFRVAAEDNTFYSAHLFSDWSDVFSTEVNLSYKDYLRNSVNSSSWGEINIRTEDGSIIAGQDDSYQANELANEVWTFGVHGTYLAGDVQYRFGAEMEDTWNYNLYGRNAAGTWTFDSIDDFENQVIGDFTYGNAYTNDIQDIAYDVSGTTYAFYGEATLEPFTDFELVAGLRYEKQSIDSKPGLNQNFLDTYGYANTENLDGADIWLPRVGFTWDLRDDLTLRGGVGRYSGGTPLVWISNAYTNDGTTLDSVTLGSLDPSVVDFTRVPQVAMDALEAGTGSTNNIDPNFKLPSDWRYQLAADYVFDIPSVGEDFNWTTELTYTDRQDSVYWRDLSRVDNGNRTVDGRIIWDNVYTGTALAGNYDLELTNVDDGGRSIILTTSLDKVFDNGVSFNLSYTHQDITEVNPGTSSTATSNYQYEVTKNRNEPLLGTAYYEVEHRFVLNLGYRKEFVQGYATNFNLFWERRSGRPFSWVLGSYKDTDLGDQTAFYQSDVYLPYIPSGADDPAVDFASGLSYDEIMAYAEAAGVAGSAGGYVDKYSGTQPWVTTMDLAITQELPGFTPEHRGMLYLTIDNFANLLNDDWGKVYDLEYPQKLLYDYDVNANGQYVYYAPFGNTNSEDGSLNANNYSRFRAEQSTWRVKVGLKYNF